MTDDDGGVRARVGADAAAAEGRGPGTAPTSAEPVRPGALTRRAVLELQRTAGNAAVTAVIQRQAVQTASGSFVGDKSGATDNVREEVLPVMDRLHMLWSMSNPDYDDEYPKVSAKPPKTSLPPAELPKTIAAIKKNEEKSVAPAVAQQFLRATIASAVGKGQPNKQADVEAVQDGLKDTGVLSPADHFAEKPSAPVGTVDEAKIPKTLDALGRFKVSAAAGTFRRDLFAGVTPVTPTQHAEIGAILAGPGATLVPGKMGKPPTVKLPGPMTGAGVGGAFETEMVAAMKKRIGDWAKEFRTLKAKGPAFPVASANDIAVAAQEEVERYYAPYLKAASRKPADKYHPGVYSLTAKLGDQSTRALADDDRRGWLDYFMSTKGYGGKEVMDKHRCLPTERSGTDGVEYYRVLEVILKSMKTDIDDAIHGWPAEAGTGTVFIQPYGDSDPKALRGKRWELFTTLIHEMMHVLEHPNFGRTATAIGRPGTTILTEGFAEVMRTDLWKGGGALEARLASLDALREKVEGKKQPYDAGAIVDAAYYDEYNDAKKIVDKVGLPNAKAAFFLGHTDLLGLGAGTASATPLTGIGMWTDKDAESAELYVVKAGESEPDVARKTKAPKLLTDAGAPVPKGSALAAGTKIRAPGIRWLWAVDGDTLASVATQNDVSKDDLAAANDMPPASPPTTSIAAGTRVLIPVHAAVSP